MLLVQEPLVGEDIMWMDPDVKLPAAAAEELTWCVCSRPPHTGGGVLNCPKRDRGRLCNWGMGGRRVDLSQHLSERNELCIEALC